VCGSWWGGGGGKWVVGVFLWGGIGGGGGGESSMFVYSPSYTCINLMPRRDTPSAVSSGFMVTTMWRKRELVRQGQQERQPLHRYKYVVKRSWENVQILLGEYFLAFKIAACSTEIFYSLTVCLR